MFISGRLIALEPLDYCLSLKFSYTTQTQILYFQSINDKAHKRLRIKFINSQPSLFSHIQDNRYIIFLENIKPSMVIIKLYVIQF